MDATRKMIVICFMAAGLAMVGCTLARTTGPTLTPAQTLTITIPPTQTITSIPSDTPTITPRPTPYGGATGKLLVLSGGSLSLFDVGTGASSQLMNSVSDFAWSPDGRQIAVIGQSGTLPQGLYLISPDDGSTSPVVARTDVNSIVWSPDSAILAFQLSHAKNYFFQQDITLFYLDKANLLTLLTRTAENHFTQISVSSYIFSPDESRIFFAATIGSMKRSGIYEIVTRFGTTPAPLAEIKSEFVTNLRLSPDGKKLAFINCDEENIYMLDLASHSVSKLTDLPPEQSSLCFMPFEWSPDGNSIVFLRSGTIYRINSDGTNIVTLMNDVLPVSTLTFSPDGKLITFTSYENNKVGIYTMNADGTNKTRLTDGDFAKWQPILK
ncbi:MAG TPA: hypothetical protein VMC09_17615 [Anaerolineales bacterium]|nr:hypothetical protein [Anaerolineales bacterium]